METIPNKHEKLELKIEISGAVHDDSEGINIVLYEAWLATYPNEEVGITVEDVEESYKDRLSPERIEKGKERLRNIPENERRLVAKVDGRIVGVSRVIKEEGHNTLQTLYVLPEYQGKGVGTALWEEGRKFLDPTKDVVLEVATYNENAINFYKKLGFEDTGKRFTDERFRMKSGNIVPEMEMKQRAQAQSNS